MSSKSSEQMYTAYLKGSLKLDRFGEWWHEGSPFQNKKLAQLFHEHIVWDNAESGYFVQIGKQRASFDCEDTGYFVLELLDSALPWRVRISDGQVQLLNLASLSVGDEGQIYCRVHHDHLARFTRSAYQALISHLTDDGKLAVGKELVNLGSKE